MCMCAYVYMRLGVSIRSVHACSMHVVYSMCICVVCECSHMHYTYDMYADTNTHTHTHTGVCVGVHVYSMCVYMQACVRACMRMSHTHTSTCTHSVHMCILTCIVYNGGVCACVWCVCGMYVHDMHTPPHMHTHTL